MFISSDLVYLQLQKTACTHISKILEKVVGGSQTPVKHNWLTSYDNEKIIIGSIRNPWDWYVSLWAYGCSNRGRLWEHLTKKGADVRRVFRFFMQGKFYPLWAEITKNTKEWQHLYSDVYNPILFRQWLERIFNPENHIYLGERYFESSISEFAGFFTYRYCYIYLRDFFSKKHFMNIHNLNELIEFDNTHNLTDYIVRTENLEQDIIRILHDIGYDLKTGTIDWIYAQKEEKTNKSERMNLTFYYDRESVEMVNEREKFIIEKYDYKEPSFWF